MQELSGVALFKLDAHRLRSNSSALSLHQNGKSQIAENNRDYKFSDQIFFPGLALISAIA
jgi:hypothetical protein